MMNAVLQLLVGTSEELDSAEGALVLERYQSLYRQAITEHSKIEIESESYAKYMRERLPGKQPIAEELAAFSAPGDLYLACGCSNGDADAVAVFYREYESHMRAMIGGLRLAGDRLDDLVSIVCHKLLVEKDGRAPRISEYQGQGRLLTWLRVVAVRIAISESRKKTPEVSDDELLRNVASPHSNPQIAVIKADAHRYIKAAFQQAMTELTMRQRNMLRQHLIDNLTIDDLGALYHVHRVTAARWLSKARAELWSKTKKHLRAELDISSSQIDSLLGEIRSTLDLSIERALTD